MENRKIIVAVTAIAVLLLLFAGVGYAVSNGNARTYNEGNTDTLAYMTATPDSFSPMAENVTTLFDTYAYDATYNVVANSTEAAFNEDTYYIFNGGYVKAKDGVRTYDAGTTYYTKDAGIAKAYVFNTENPGVALDVFVKVASPDQEQVSTYFVISDGDYVPAGEYSPSAEYYTKTVYTSNALGTETIALENQTGAEITQVDLAIKATPAAIGNSDFVFIFKVAGTGAAKYAVFNGVTDLSVEDIACEMGDGAAPVNVSVSLYVAYIPNVYVPDTYIGAASAVEQTGYLPYICPVNAPADLAETAFGFTFTDATPEP